MKAKLGPVAYAQWLEDMKALPKPPRKPDRRKRDAIIARGKKRAKWRKWRAHLRLRMQAQRTLAVVMRVRPPGQTWSADGVSLSTKCLTILARNPHAEHESLFIARNIWPRPNWSTVIVALRDARRRGLVTIRRWGVDEEGAPPRNGAYPKPRLTFKITQHGLDFLEIYGGWFGNLERPAQKFLKR